MTIRTSRSSAPLSAPQSQNRFTVHHPKHTLVIPLFFAVPRLQGLTQMPPPQMSAPHWEIQLPAFSCLPLHQLLSGTFWGGLCGVGSSTTASPLVPSSTPAPLQCFPQSRYVDIFKTLFDGFILLLIVLRIESNLLWALGCHLSSAQPLPLPLATVYLSSGYICLLSVPKHVRLVSILGLLHLQKAF